jgi:hypothetical protein
LQQLQRTCGNQFVLRLVQHEGARATGPVLQRDPDTASAPPKNAREWQNTAEQKQFLADVLQAHIEKSTRSKGAPKADLKDSDLAPVAGTSIKMQKDAAAAAGSLLSAAESELKAAKAAKDPDALLTVGLGAASGYRPRAHQDRLWHSYFPKYYERTVAQRAKFPDKHGPEAVAFMVKFISPKIAAPGFSNHQAGLAIDFAQRREAGHEIKNDTSGEAMTRWRETWFFKWLRANAATYKFTEYSGEAWHWTFRQAAGALQPAAVAV